MSVPKGWEGNSSHIAVKVPKLPGVWAEKTTMDKMYLGIKMKSEKQKGS